MVKKSNKHERVLLNLLYIFIGVVLGQAWAIAQEHHREQLCKEYGTHCKGSVEVSE